MKGRALLAAAVAAALVGGTVAGCGGSGSDVEADKSGGATDLTVILPFRESLFYRELSIAKEMGYFEEEKLAPEFVNADGGPPTVQQLLGGGGPVARIPVSDALPAMARRSDVRAFYSVGSRNLFDIVVPADSEIQSVEDLDGKTLGITSFASGEVPWVVAALGGVGLGFDEEVSIRVVTDSGPTIVRALQTGQIDAFAGTANETVPVGIAGIETRSVMPEELAGLPANTLLTLEETLTSEDGRQALVGFARASAKGEYFAIVNPDAGLCISKDDVPEDHSDAEFAESLYEEVTELSRPPEPSRWGELSPEAWKSVQEVILQGADDKQAVLKEPVEGLEEKVTNELIEEINDWDREAVKADAEKMDVTYPEC